MKKSEKIISAVALMVLGILFIALKGSFIGLLMTVAGVSFLVLGVADIIDKLIPQAVIKIVSGVLLIVAGWAIAEVVLYILAAMLLIFGILILYDKIKRRVCCEKLWQTLLEYALPCVCILVGILFLFNQTAIANFVFVVNGIFLLLLGGTQLLKCFLDD